MALIKKLKDTEEGLIGITTKGERVHLGKPIVYSQIEGYGYTSYKDAIKAFCYQFIGDLQERKREEAFKRLEKSLEENDNGYWYFDADDFCSKSRNDQAFSYTYLRFDKSKEKAFSEGERRYEEKDLFETKYIPIHRVGSGEN
jgi:hypothetical protein